MDFLLPIWNPFIVFPLMNGLRALANPLQTVVSPGLAGGLAIILFTLVLKLLLLPFSLQAVRSQRAQLAIQPEMQALQKKFKGDREGLARAQMQLYKERGVNPAAGCLPMLVQMPILFGMYAALLHLSTVGLTLDQVQTRALQPGQVTYEARRTEQPLPLNQFVLATLTVIPRGEGPIELQIPQDAVQVANGGTVLTGPTQGLTLTPGQATSNPNPPNTPGGQAALFLRPGGERNPDGTLNRSVPVQVGKPYLVELEVNAPQTRVDYARAVVQYDPARLEVADAATPPLENLPFKSEFLWLPSLGEPDLIHLFGLGIPGLLLLLMTITSYVSQRMSTLPTADPQQQQMMKMMAFMPLMYLFFFLQTPAGLVLYWLISNLFQMVQQYFTTGMGLLAGDLKRVTGRDFQPAWAHVGPHAPPAPAVPHDPGRDGPQRTLLDSRNGTNITPARNGRSAALPRTGRSTPGKGRKRGKR